MSHDDFATPEGTQEWALQFSNMVFQPLGTTRLRVSPAGFGSYRIGIGAPHQHQALEEAILSGINIIDTSSNYMDGESEMLIGEVLHTLIASSKIKRNQIVVVSKAGYLQGQNYQLSQDKKKDGKPFPDLVEYEEGLEHCIHPEFLSDQLTRSLDRLQLSTLDVFLLHNPEYFLSWAKKENLNKEEAKEMFYDRIQFAFQHLEREVRNGRISYYGISANTFPSSSFQYSFVSLEKVWEIAKKISPEHHFRVIQLPANLIETAAFTEKNQSSQRTVIEAASHYRLGVLINRPLNAIMGPHVIRLADYEVDHIPTEDMIESEILTLWNSEKYMHDHLFPAAQKKIPNAILVRFTLGELLQEHWKKMEGYSHWKELLGNYILPQTEHRIGQLVHVEDDAILEWIESYLKQIYSLTKMMTEYYQSQANARSEKIKAFVADTTPDWQCPNLSQTALRALRSTQGVTAVLVGMRESAYVQDVVVECQQTIKIQDRKSQWKSLLSHWQTLTPTLLQ